MQAIEDEYRESVQAASLHSVEASVMFGLKDSSSR